MPVKLKITLLFLLLVSLNLGMVCAGIYYFSYQSRIETIKKRLTNRAATTARLLAQREIFDQELVKRIDSLTTISLKNKTVQAFGAHNNLLYSYSDIPGDTLKIDSEILENIKDKKNIYFTESEKEAVAYHFTENNADIIVISAGEDHDGKNDLNQLSKILIISFLIGNSMVMLTGYFFSSRLLLPIKKITSDVAEISAQNLARRIKTGHSKDEWFLLTETLNGLLNRLQESFELQRRFISNASHELSTPLTSISSQLEVSLQKDRDANDYKKVIESIYQDVRHMSALTQTLLEFARASGNPGGLEINLIRTDELLMRIPYELTHYNPEYSATLQFEQLPENEDELLVFGNEELIFTAIKNIVVNACKYSADKKANITLKAENKMILIKISDKGIGIPEKELSSIFQPFYRVDESTANKGFGLGLSLAYRIIKLHKGTIEVQSELNVGTSFYITLQSAHTSYKK